VAVRWLGLGISFALLGLAPLASANGRFPRGERLLEDPADPSHLVLAATYGLLTTRDAGASWHHVCESAFAELGGEADPVAAFVADGSLLTSLYSSLSRSSADACDFATTLAAGKAEAVPDFTLEAQNADHAIAVVAAVDNGKVTSYRLHGSVDGGRSWQPFGVALPDALKLVFTVDVAPSDADRIYLSGLGAGDVGLLLRSDDRGQSFSISELPTAAESGEAPYIAAVDPQNADTLYVRTDLWSYEPETGISWARDALLYSSDAGQHFTELVRASGKLLGFALSPDGSELLLGYADPVEGLGRLTEAAGLGIYRGKAGSAEFQHVFAGSTSCLSWTQNGIYACTSQAELGFALALVDEASLVPGEYPSFHPLLDLLEVKGPLACSACSSLAVCAEAWRATCLAWGRQDCEAAGGSPGLGECVAAAGAGAGGAADAGQSASDAGGEPQATGGTGAATQGGRGVITAGAVASTEREGAGCSCSSPRSQPTPTSVGLALLLGLWGLRRRARSQLP
jgi:MYXO-CTERM domain-containing protein